MVLLWYLAGVATALSASLVVLVLMRRVPRFATMPALPWPAAAGSIAIAAVIIAAAFHSGQSAPAGDFRAAAKALDGATLGGGGAGAGQFAAATQAAGALAGGAPGAGAPAAASPGAGSMDSAIAKLEARLAKGGGSADDWELLAKSFEFLGRPDDARLARARKLPAATPAAAASSAPSASSVPSASGASISGEVTIADSLRAKAASGETLFIVAKSVDSPGIPVAVLRTRIAGWPLKFTLDDSMSMMPGRNLSSAGRVTIEARISKSGQAMPGPGDVQGTSAVLAPGNRQPVKINIDREIS
jgi:hypothetical protein